MLQLPLIIAVALMQWLPWSPHGKKVLGNLCNPPVTEALLSQERLQPLAPLYRINNVEWMDNCTGL